MQKTYTISKDSKELGPLNVDQILMALSQGQIAVTDYIYIDEKKDWVSLLEFKPIIEHLKSKKPVAAPTIELTDEPVITTISNSGEEWFLLKDDKKLGPLHYLDVVKMLQDKLAYEFDYVWTDKLAKWMRIAELREFSPERLMVLMKEHKDIFAKRKHKRVIYQNEIIVSDESELFRGKYIQLSEGGAKVKVSCSMFAPGDKIVIHHKASDTLPAFNAECEIVNKGYSQTIRNKHQEVEYIVKFLQLNDKAKKSIHDLTKKVS